MAKNQYVSERGGYTFRTQVFTTTDEDGDAIADSDLTIEKGETARVRSIQGVKLIVDKKTA